MGQSTDALLAYGIDLGEEFPELPVFEGAADADDILEHLLKIPEYGHPDRPSRKEIDAMKAAFPVEVITHCHAEYPMYFLAARGSLKQAHRGSPVELHPDDLATKLEAHAAFTAWCEAHDVTGNPRWHLFSYWG